MTNAVPIPDDLQATPAASPLCEAAGCGRALTPEQLRKGAKACSGPCRAKAHRERIRAGRLVEIDAAIRTLQALRAEVARG